MTTDAVGIPAAHGASARRVSADRWLVRFRPKGEVTLRLFCLPYAGGGASIFNHWTDGLPAGVEVCAIQLPGRGTRLRDAPISLLEPLIEASGSALRPHLDVPFALFGHSMGAFLAFELAHWLRRVHGLSPAHLFVSGQIAPGLPDPRTPVHDLPDEDFLAELVRLNGTPREILESRELMDLVLPMLRADFTLTETYRPTAGRVLDLPITALGGRDDADVSRESLEGWRAQTTGPFDVRVLPGEHFFIHSSRDLVLRVLHDKLDWLLSLADAR